MLDLGCGVGWFLLVARAMGHDIHALDNADGPVFTEMMALLDIPVTRHSIKPYKPLPAEIQGFDLVSSHMTPFNLYPDGRPWGPGEWAFLMKDLNSRLNPGATVIFELRGRD